MPVPRTATKTRIKYVNYNLFDVLNKDAPSVLETKKVTCSFCGRNVPENSYECPNCGALTEYVPELLPTFSNTFAWSVESQNYNGAYQIYRLQDESSVCTCKSFLLQRGIQTDELGFVVCKHIKEGELPPSATDKFQKIQPWQEVILKKIGVTPAEGLSFDQANFIIHELLSQNGISFAEFTALLKNNPFINELLPPYSFGVELEGLIRSRDDFQEKLYNNDIKAVLTNYDHTMRNGTWKIGDDGSVRRSLSQEEQRDFRSMELTSPKLWGYEGFREIRRVLSIWREIGGAVNASCGFHVHIDAFGFTRDELKRLVLVWAKIEPVIFYLVSKSRRHNSFCCWLRKNSGAAANIIDPFISRIEMNRYHALNLDAVNHYKTVEFRIHQGTMNPDKVINWVIFCLKLVQKVKEGLKHYHFSEEPSIEEVLDRLGIIENSIPIIKNCREFLISRYRKFKAEAEAREHTVDFSSYNDFLNEVRREVMPRVNVTFRDRYMMSSFSFPDIANLPIGHIKRLLSVLPSRNLSIGYREVIQLLDEATDGVIGGVIRFPSLSSNSSGRTYQVTYDSENETITCNCRAFRTNGHCLHTIAVARAIFIRNKLQQLEKFDF